MKTITTHQSKPETSLFSSLVALSKVIGNEQALDTIVARNMLQGISERETLEALTREGLSIKY